MRLVIMTFFLSLLTVFQLMFSFPSVHPLACHSNEQSSLLQFKESFVIDRYASPVPLAYPKVDSWKVEGNGSDCCSWDGVECDENTGHVIGLHLNASCLYGSINSNSSLFRLVSLQYLNLAFNDFNGSEIPSALGNLLELTHLNISNSLFFGQIPSEISKLSKLSLVDLSSNYNPYSEQLLKLRSPNLRSLVQNFSNLEYLALASVDISSPVPDTLANFSLLRVHLPNSRLYGTFPVAILQLPNLQFLNVGFNPKLSGHLPEVLWGEKLQSLMLYFTSFSGKLPASVGNLHSLKIFDSRGCKFSGVIPFSIGNLSKLEWLDLSNNSFSGQIPFSVGNLSKLVTLDLGDNSFSGQIPSSIFNHNNLETLYLHSNNLSGTVELDQFFTLKKLTSLHLSDNNLVVSSKTRTNGTLPNQFVSLGLHSCSLTDFPHILLNQTNLQWLDLSINNLHGKIPSLLWTVSIDTLEFLDLSNQP